MTPDQINDFFSFLYEGRLGAITFWLRLIAGVITSALVAALAVIVVKFRQLNRRGSSPQYVSPGDRVTSPGGSAPWQDVLQKIESPNPSDWNLAVIKADAVFDNVLEDMGLPGPMLGDRLKQLDTSKLSSLNDVWEAHKLRNRIVHESERVLTHEEAKRSVSLFEKALRELQYLQE